VSNKNRIEQIYYSESDGSGRNQVVKNTVVSVALEADTSIEQAWVLDRIVVTLQKGPDGQKLVFYEKALVPGTVQQPLVYSNAEAHNDVYQNSTHIEVN
jgi:hypothetical protein